MSHIVRSLHVGVKSTHTVVEGFLLVSELPTELTHPVDVVLTVFDVECIWVVVLAKILTLLESLQDLVHWHLGLERLF